MSRPKPIHTAKCGSVRIPITAFTDGRFCIAWRAYAGAPRRRELFRTKAAAIHRADEIARATASGLSDVLTLTSADRDHYQRATRICKDLGTTLPVAIEEYATARRLIAPHTLTEAATLFQQQKLQPHICPPMSDIITAILASLRDNPIQPRTDAYLRTIKPRLTAISSTFGELRDLTPTSVSAFLLGLRYKGRAVSAKTYNHYRAAIALVWKWSGARGYATGPSPLATIKAFAAPGKREVLTLPELRAILAHAAEYWIPFVTLGAFAGLRVCEIARLPWSDIVWEQDEIRITEAVAGKRGTPRNVPITAALRAWLYPQRKEIGKIYDLDERKLTDHADDFYRSLEKAIPSFRWKANALRHSFGSYHVATHRNLELTRTIMGTGMSMLRHHYNDPQFRNHAEAYWKILPSTEKANVIAMRPGASL